MAEQSNIEWTTHTFNPWRGCTKVSPGCQHCYAESLSKRNPAVLGQWGPNGTRVVAAEAQWRLPAKWDRAAAAAGERHRVFCASLADVFERWEGPITDAAGCGLYRCIRCQQWIDGPAPKVQGAVGPYCMRCEAHTFPLLLADVRSRLFATIDGTPNLDWQLLTKRPQNVLRMAYDAWCKPVPGHVSQNKGDGRRWDWPTNVWLGTSVENQAAADERIPHLLRCPAAVRFLSAEPLLGPVDVRRFMPSSDGFVCPDDETGAWHVDDGAPSVDWVIAGGESGPHARPMHPEWARSLRDQCLGAGVPFFFKQWGEIAPEEQVPGLFRRPIPDHMVGRISWPFKAGQDFGPSMARVGKASAGRLLDGREWNDFPLTRQEA